MELIRGLHNLRPRHRGCALTIGNFDGVHRGHRAVLAQLEGIAAQAGMPTVLMTFEPQPQEFFAGANAPARLTRLREKLRALQATGVARVLVVRFDAALSRLEPGEFIERVLVAGLGVRHVVIGDDFRFGYRARGDFALLREAGAALGFEVERTATRRVEGRRVSSGWVREALAAGELDRAAGLLGRPYRMCGRVVSGDARGRTLGFPTANIALGRRVSPLAGVFAVRVHGAGGAPRAGMANIGTNPTVGGTRGRLEVHLFDFEGDLYGRRLGVEFVRKLREEVRFASLEELRRAMAHDELEARDVLSEPSR